MNNFVVTITLRLKGDDEDEVKDLVTNALEDLIASDTLEESYTVEVEEEEEDDL